MGGNPLEREEFLAKFQEEVLAQSGRLYRVSPDAFGLIPDYEGCANLVYEYQRDGQPLILRISFRPDRTADLVQAELDFVEYLAAGNVRVSRPVPSTGGNLLESVTVGDLRLPIACFVRGRGMRVPDNNYHYRTDAPIEEYFQNWGHVLGQMHALSMDYHPRQPRPDWETLHRDGFDILTEIQERLPRVCERIRALLDEIRTLPQEAGAYGLIHGDFNDGNFTVDYENGDITVFDFDDCCHFWFVYELAAAWEGGIGRIRSRGVDERRAFMDHYMEQVLAGYERAHHVADVWLERLPLFVRLIQVEEFLHFAQYLDSPNPKIQAHLKYLIRCIEDEIPFMGFFDPVVSLEHPY